MGCNFHQQPQQQAGKPHRLWTQVQGPALGLCYDFGVVF